MVPMCGFIVFPFPHVVRLVPIPDGFRPDESAVTGSGEPPADTPIQRANPAGFYPISTGKRHRLVETRQLDFPAQLCLRPGVPTFSSSGRNGVQFMRDPYPTCSVRTRVENHHES